MQNRNYTSKRILLKGGGDEYKIGEDLERVDLCFTL